MTLRKGDRVRFEFEGVVMADPLGGSGVLVEDDEHRYSTYVPVDSVEVIIPSFAVGDELTVGVDPEPPLGTVVLFETGEAARRVADGWTYASTGCGVYQWDVMARKRVAVVHVGSGS